MGQWKYFDDPHKPVYDKHWYDPQLNIQKIAKDHIYYVPRHWVGPDPGPLQFDPSEGLLPFALTTPHQYGAHLSKEETQKASMEMFDSMIRQAEYQIDMLKAQVDALNKQRENLKGYSQE